MLKIFKYQDSSKLTWGTRQRRILHIDVFDFYTQLLGPAEFVIDKLKHIVDNISTNLKLAEGEEILKLSLNEIWPTDMIEWWT